MSAGGAGRPLRVKVVRVREGGGDGGGFLRGVKGIIFDFDGTLFDHSGIGLRVVKARPADIFRIAQERRVRRGFAGRDYPSPESYYNVFFEALGRACLCSPSKIRAWYFDIYMPRIACVLKKSYKPRAGARVLLNLLSAPQREGLPKAAVYSDYPFLKERMEAVGLFTEASLPLHGPHTLGAQKPAASGFLRIAADLGLETGEVLVVGDREDTDGLGAFNSGMRFYLVDSKSRHAARDRGEDRQDAPFVMFAGTWEAFLQVFERAFAPGLLA